MKHGILVGMRTSQLALTLTLAAGLLLGCRKDYEPQLREELTKSGLTEIKITRLKDGSYDYTAENKDGELCTGGRRFQSSFGSETSQGGEVCMIGTESDAGYEARNRRACDRGSAAACGRLGVLLGQREGSAQEGRTILKKSCTGQNYEACGNLGILLLSDKGGPKDPKAARELIKTACEHEIVSRCGTLAIMLIEGEGGPKDLAGARAHLETACAGDHLQSCHNLGVSRLNGEGGPKDLKGAQEALDKACKGEYQSACELAGKLKAALAK